MSFAASNSSCNSIMASNSQIKPKPSSSLTNRALKASSTTLQLHFSYGFKPSPWISFDHVIKNLENNDILRNVPLFHAMPLVSYVRINKKTLKIIIKRQFLIIFMTNCKAQHFSHIPVTISCDLLVLIKSPCLFIGKI